MTRSPFVLFEGRFWAEEGNTHFQKMLLDDSPGDLLFVPTRAGYYNLFCNLVTWAASNVSIVRAPLVTGWLSFAVIGLVAWVALTWPSELLPTAGSRIAAAVLLIVGTLAIPEVWLNSVNAQTYLGILTLLLLFVDVERVGGARFLAGAGMLAVSGISGIYSALLAPLYLVRAFQERTLRCVIYAAIITGAALVELMVVFNLRARGDVVETKMVFPGLGSMTADAAGWHVSGFLFGPKIAREFVQPFPSRQGLVVLALFAFTVLAFLGLLLLKTPSRRVPLLLGTAFVLTELFVLYGAHRGAGGRYAVVPIGILTLMLIHGAATARHSWLSHVATALCGVVLLAGLSAFWTNEPRHLRCIDCPNWSDEVRQWKAGVDNELAIWPYPEWHLQLPPRSEAN